MARLKWTGRAIADLNDIADYIALDNPDAARRVARRVYRHVKQLVKHPYSGSVPDELEDTKYRQIVELPCRIFYEVRGETVFILHVIRSEQILRVERLETPE